MKVTIAKSTYGNIEKITGKQVFEDVIEILWDYIGWSDERYVIVKQKNKQTVIPHSEVGRIIIEHNRDDKIPHIYSN